MSPSPAGEDALVERPAIEWLTEAGWAHVDGRELGADRLGAERRLWSDVVLVGRLRAAVARLNPELPPDAVERVCGLAMTGTSPSLIEDHRGFHELLTSGVPVTYRDADGVEQHRRARLVDFESPQKNELLAVNQLTIIFEENNRRPDIVVFVNGLPLGQIECKAPGELDSAQKAVNQVRHYTETIPALYRYVEIVGVSDLMRARVGTAGTSAEHFSEWKASEEKDPRPQLQVMIEEVFAPERFLELIYDFLLFQTDGATSWKVMAKYHQVQAVHAAVESVAEAMEGDHRGGIVWHTQGAGKSYTMVFFANKLRHDPRFANPTIVAVTDRTNLDDQLAGTFASTHLASSCRQAEEIAGGPNSLHELLKVPAGGIVFTTIQKFASEKDEPMPVLCERSNVVVMADEAHRSQYDSFARNITAALPNATRIGFTGTPVESSDRSTRLVFGDYVSVYRMRRAQEDQATVPIFYESRQIPIAVGDQDALREVEEVLEAEEDEAASSLAGRWARLEKVVGAPERIERLCDDVHSHFSARCEELPGKAMVVAYSRRVAAAIATELQERFGEQAVTCVISATATDPQEMSRFRRSKAQLHALAKDFRDPDSELRIVVVKDMWLTGFDAPVLHTLYIDKPMRDHGLLQAIARVNRVFREKAGGLVVDYIGIGEDLRSSLRAYDAEELEDPAIPLAQAISGMWEKYEVICAMLHPAGYRRGELSDAVDSSQLFRDCYDHLLADEQRMRSYLDEYAALAKWHALIASQQAAIELHNEVVFFKRLAAEVRSIATPVASASPEAELAVSQFMSQGLAAGQIEQALALAAEDRPDISVLSDEFLDSLAAESEHRNIQIRMLERLLRGEVGSRGRVSRARAKLFRERLDDVLARYEQRQITAAEVIKVMVEMAKDVRDDRDRHKQLGLTREEAAFYDALAGASEDGALTANPEIATIARELVKSIRADLAVDWADRESSEAEIRVKVKRLLRRHKYQAPSPPGANGGGGDDLNRGTQLVLEQAKALYRYWPEVEGRLFE